MGAEEARVSYKLQVLRNPNNESKFCIGGQTRTDNLPYRIFYSCVRVLYVYNL